MDKTYERIEAHAPCVKNCKSLALGSIRQSALGWKVEVKRCRNRAASGISPQKLATVWDVEATVEEVVIHRCVVSGAELSRKNENHN